MLSKLTSGSVEDVMFPYKEGIGPNQKRRLRFVWFARWRDRGEVYCHRLKTTITVINK